MSRICSGIGTNWKDLARILGFDNSKINTISANSPYDINQQCAEMLDSYLRDKGSDFTKLVLVKALITSGLRLIAEENNLID